MSTVQGADPVRDTCSLTGHATLAVGDILYIQGGRMIYDWQINWQGYGQNPYLRVLNLTGTVRQNDVPNNLETVQFNTAPYNWNDETIQDTRLPVFWLDQVGNKAYLALGARVNIDNTSYIGGQDYNPGKPGKMWTADLLDGDILTGWTEVDMKAGNRNLNLVGTASQWFDPETRMGYVWGGSYEDFAEQDFSVNQLLTFNAATGVWKNETTPFDQSSSGFLQGITLNNRTVLIAGLGVPNGQLGAVDTIRVYDTETQQWYTQRTNGDLPSNRYWAGCSIVVPAPDKSSYQIITYGGANNQDTFGDVWALSIPSFTWVKLSDDVTSNSAAKPRNGDLAWFFDLNLLEWSIQISGGEPEDYRVPQPVFEAIGGNAEGGATLTQPPGGFTQQNMTTVFAAFATSTTSGSPTSITTSSETTTGASSKDPGSSISGGAIGGIVVGAIAGIALIAIGVWFFLRKRRQPIPELATPEPPPPPGGLRPPHKGYGSNYPPSELGYTPVLPMELHGEQNVPKVELPGSEPYDGTAPTAPRQQGPYEFPV
ncbi:hypothetical protein ABW20_dc0104016 [Dactylellina cionopaga]|nr:hypothetical protein ABW20_dc0104016 [Dactylellina cionopaga]